MYIKMKENKEGAEKGIHLHNFEKNKTYNVSEELADAFIKDGFAEKIDENILSENEKKEVVHSSNLHKADKHHAGKETQNPETYNANTNTTLNQDKPAQRTVIDSEEVVNSTEKKLKNDEKNNRQQKNMTEKEYQNK